jgi:hypothetical protein
MVHDGEGATSTLQTHSEVQRVRLDVVLFSRCGGQTDILELRVLSGLVSVDVSEFGCSDEGRHGARDNEDI